MSFVNVLFFEGENDLYPVGHLIDLLPEVTTEFVDDAPSDPGQAIGLEEFGGYDPLRGDFPTRIRLSSTFQRIGIIADADDEPLNRWKSLTDALQNAGTVDCPDEPVKDGWAGTVELKDRTVEVGLWMRPDNRGEGAVEDFLLKLIPEEDPLLPRAENSLDTVSEPLRPERSKALLRTWLAWQEEPGRPLGPAVSERYFDLEAELATRFVAWILRLFDLDGSAATP